MTSLCAAFLVLLLSSSNALAAPLNPRPWTDVRDSGETTLQEILDGAFGVGVKDAISDQSSEGFFPAIGGHRGIGPLEVVFVSDPAAFGTYDVADPSSLTQIFSTASVPGDSSSVVPTDPSNFGWYAESPISTFFSEDDLNSGTPRALVFAPLFNGSRFIQLPSGAALWGDLLVVTTRIIAFETGTDNDFQDIVVYAAIPVPEPSSLLLLGVGVAAVIGLRWRRFSPAFMTSHCAVVLVLVLSSSNAAAAPLYRAASRSASIRLM